MFLRFARKILNSVLSGLAKQLNVVESMAMAPMRAMVQLVAGGEIWKGKGADAFVREVSTMMIPGVGQVMSQISTMSSNLTRASEIIDEADKRAQAMANSTGDIFGGIY